MITVFDRGTRLHVRMRTTLENGDQGEFEAMKTPIGRRAPRCDKDQFHAFMMVST